MTDLTGSPDIIMVWPAGRALPVPEPVAGYSIQSLPRALDSWWIDIHRKAVPSFAAPDLERWLERYRSLALAEGILIATHDATHEPVATAGSIANSKDGMFPGGGQLAWVATVPEHRQRGLAHWLSTLATIRMHRDGFTRIFLCTGDDLIPAIGVYLRMGYVPCLYASDQRDRWSRICETVGHPFEPDQWPTPEAYLSSGHERPRD